MIGDILWTPPADWRDTTEIGRFVNWLRDERRHEFSNFDQLWRWSVADLDGFWGGLWDFYGIRATPYERVLGKRTMPGAEWFVGARLNYAEHLLGTEEDRDRVAVVARSQTRPPRELTFGELIEQAGRVRAGLQRLGVQAGDRVVAYMPNIPETLIGFIATASLGAIWATCAPEFGARSVVGRFAQIEPRVLITVGGYGFRDRYVDRRAEVEAIRARIPIDRARDQRSLRRGAGSGLDRMGGPDRGERAARVRAGRVRPSTVRAVLLGHDRPAEADRARSRRPADRAPEEPRARVGSQARRSAAVVLDHRVDDVERARRRAPAARVDRDARRRPGVARSARAVAPGRGAPAVGDGGQPRVSDGVPQGRARARARVRPVEHPDALHGGIAAARRRATCTRTNSSARTCC